METKCRICCIGEIMRESLFNVSIYPAQNSTVILKNENDKSSFGGTAVNVVWNLSKMKFFSTLLSVISEEDLLSFSKTMRSPYINYEHLEILENGTDKLLSIVTPTNHLSLYQINKFPVGIINKFFQIATNFDFLVLSGGRHPEIRKVFEKLSRLKRSKSVTLFCPSYSVYEYSKDQLGRIIEGVDYCVLNKEEFLYVSKKIGRRHLELLPKISLIVTLSSDGVWLFTGKKKKHFTSLVNRSGVFLGAGDAFVSGFVSGIVEEKGVEYSVKVGQRIASKIVKSGKVRL